MDTQRVGPCTFAGCDTKGQQETVLVRAEQGVQVSGVTPEVGGGGQGLRHWQAVPQCLETRAVLGSGPGKKEHGCEPCTLTTSCLRSLQEWGTWETTEDAGSGPG